MPFCNQICFGLSIVICSSDIYFCKISNKSLFIIEPLDINKEIVNICTYIIYAIIFTTIYVCVIKTKEIVNIIHQYFSPFIQSTFGYIIIPSNSSPSL